MIHHTIPALYHMTFWQAIVIGLIQGVTELFPISSLGHTVLLPSWFGGTWALLVRQESMSNSPYLAFIVGLHLATAIVLLGFYAKEWIRLIGGFLRSCYRRKIETDSERLAWLIVVATIPVGLLGLIFEHLFRTLFAKPVAAAIFLTINGAILGLGEFYRRRSQRGTVLTEVTSSDAPEPTSTPRFRDERIVPMDDASEHALSKVGVLGSFIIGALQAVALLAGISREGIAMVGGLYRGLSNLDALRFSFLLSTPVIFAAGALKVPDLFGPLGNGIRPEIFAGSAAALLTSLFAVIFLARYFKTRTLVPFAVYSIIFGLASVVRFGIF